MKKILIVEDEISYLNLLHKELTAKGYAVVDAKDGKEGYDTALIIHPDLIILDIIMKGVDGLTMLEQLRATDIPLVPTHGDVRECRSVTI